MFNQRKNAIRFSLFIFFIEYREWKKVKTESYKQSSLIVR